MRVIGCSSAPAQSDMHKLQDIVRRHIEDQALIDFVTSKDFMQTPTERGLQRYEQAHLVAALDVLNVYQDGRRARSMGLHLGMSKHYKDDTRTRLVELLKRWLRENANCQSVSEDQVRSMTGLCREILNHPELFPARNPRSFLQSIAEVYGHLNIQLREALEKDRSCADLTQRALSLSRNLISDAVAFLLLAGSSLHQTDSLPSLEVVALWQTLPEEGHPLPGRADPQLQKAMKEAWRSRVGSIISSLLTSQWALRLYAGAEAEAAAAHAAPLSQLALEDGVRSTFASSALAALREARADFESGRFKNSGLCGALRTPEQAVALQGFMQAAETVLELTYLLGEVMIQFHRISDTLGDYGTIRMSSWLHPCIEALLEKVQRLKSHLESVNSALESVYVLARARGQHVEKPAPTRRMCARAHAAIERAVTGRSSHTQVLVQLLEELKGRSDPTRMPTVMEGLGTACTSLQKVLASPEFKSIVGTSFPELPPLSSGSSDLSLRAAATSSKRPHTLSIEDVHSQPRVEIEELSEDEEQGPLQMQVSFSGTTCTPDSSSSTWVPAVRGVSEPQPGGVSTRKVERAFTFTGGGLMLRAEVYRLCWSSRFTCGGAMLQRHDQRIVEVVGDRLLIYQKGSLQIIKSTIDISTGVAECSLHREGVLRLLLLRLPPGARPSDGVHECKEYFFEFPTAQLARDFHRALSPESQR